MANSLLRDLDHDWASISTSVWARRSVARWTRTHPRLRGYRDLGDVVDQIQRGDQTTSTQTCWALLELVADNDELATRTLLQAMVPLLGRELRRRLRVAPVGSVEIDHVLVTSANEAIHELAGSRPTWPICDLASRARRLSLQVERRAERWEQLHLLDEDLEFVSLQNDRAQEQAMSPGEELAELLREVAEAGSISDEEIELVWRSRVVGVSTHEMAASYGATPAVFRRRRHRVERRFVEALRQVAA